MKDLSRAYSAAFYGARRVAMARDPLRQPSGRAGDRRLARDAYRPGVPAVAGVYLVAGLWLIGTCWGQARWLGPVRPIMRAWRRVIVSSLPLFGLGLLTMIQLRIDSSLLGLLRPFTDVANYAASARLFEASQAIVRPLIQVFLPIAAGLAAACAYAELRHSLLRLTALALAAGAATALVVALVADPAIEIIYGAGFAPAAEILRIHFAATPFVFVGAIAMFHLTALRRERMALALRRRLRRPQCGARPAADSHGRRSWCCLRDAGRRGFDGGVAADADLAHPGQAHGACPHGRARGGTDRPCLRLV